MTIVVGAAGYGFWRLHSELISVQAELRHTKANLVKAVSHLQSTAAALSQRTQQRNDLQSSLDRAQSDLAELNQRLSGETLKALSETNVANTLSQCLAGVQDALNAISIGDNSKAVASLDGVSGSCQQAQRDSGVAAAASGGPSYPFDFPDPDVIRVGSTYYAYATNSALGTIQAIQSSDLASWYSQGDPLSALPDWASSGFTWSPDVMAVGGQYVLYYATTVKFEGIDCISVATAPDPTGPFRDSSSAPMVCQTSHGGSIDPDPFFDSKGHPYLAWMTGQGNGSPDEIWSASLSADGLSLTSTPAVVYTPEQSWEAGVAEDPAMLYYNGTYYLFFSGNRWNTASYAIGLALCSSPAGPCRALSGPVLSSEANIVTGPGGPAPFCDSAGNLYLGFHGWLPGKVGYPNSRELFVRHMSLSGGSVSFHYL